MEILGWILVLLGLGGLIGVVNEYRYAAYKHKESMKSWTEQNQYRLDEIEKARGMEKRRLTEYLERKPTPDLEDINLMLIMALGSLFLGWAFIIAF